MPNTRPNTRLKPIFPPPRTQAARYSHNIHSPQVLVAQPFRPFRSQLTFLVPFPTSFPWNSPNPSTQPAKPAFRMRSSLTCLTPQPGAPLYGPNPQRRERYPSEPPPLTALIENPIFVKPPSASQDYRHLNDVPSSLTPGSLVGAQKLVCILGSYSLFSLSLIGFISRTLPPTDLTLSPQATAHRR
jgi:hypothetical protein